MEMNNNNYCVILAGGKGKRLWPFSKENKPKQFIDKVSKASYWKKEGVKMKFDAVVGNPP